jgi:hypothetical protein
MSSDFSTVLVKDDRIGAITSSVKYGVYKSGSNVTTAVYNAISGADALNPSTVVFSLQVPSESVVVDRRVKFGATLELQVSCPTAAIPGGAAAINWASSDGLGAFPLHSLFSSMNVTINNNSVSVQQQEIQAAILQLQDSEYYKRWGGGAPNKKDVLQQYSQSKGTVISSIGGFDNVADTDSQARGSWNVNSVSQGVVVGANTVFTISIDLVEYLMVSPFIWDDTHNPAGLLGIQTLNFQFQLGSLSRCFRTANQASNNLALAKTCIGVTLRNPRLIFQFLSLHADEQIPSRNVVPYMEYPLYKTRSSVAVAQLPAADANTGAVVLPPYEIVSNTFSLNQIPDKLLIYVRKPFSTMTNGDADAFMPINNISISFNNSQGILSGADQYTLWQMSVESGSNQSWQEFRGFATVPNIGNNIPSRVATIGSCLILDMAKCVQISDSFLAPGSVGQFSLQVTVRGYNNFPEVITPELTVICVNSGLFVCDRGQSTSFSGLLQKSLVLDASAKPAYTEGDVERLVGGKKRMVASMMGMEPMGSAAPGGSSVTGGVVPGSSQTGGRLQTRFK